MKPHIPAADPVPDAGFETLCVHYGEDAATRCGAAAPPIYQTSTFLYPDADAFSRRKRDGTPHYDYTRGGNPTTSVLEAKLARLEHGAWAECFASGMGAISAAVNICVEAGSHVVSIANVYAPTRWYLQHLRRFGVETTFVAGGATEDFVAALRPETKLLYLESPTTGYFELLDVPALAQAARARGVLTIFDNSWATPYFQCPLEFGVDLVAHSATKYIGGHSDVVAGAIVGRDADLRKRLLRETELCGATMDPFAAWLLLRGLRTLSLRMDRHQSSALAIARMLAEHPRVEAVHHPGLEDHPGHARALRQMRGCAGLFSFSPLEQSKDATHGFLDRLKLFQHGVSWGGHESLAIGGTFFGTDRDKPHWLIRLHVGLESPADLLADVRQALEA
ncbi:MAG: PLP-dependent aspartate aminotransferase family protein [Phycisphaerae bacterium]